MQKLKLIADDVLFIDSDGSDMINFNFFVSVKHLQDFNNSIRLSLKVFYIQI